MYTLVFSCIAVIMIYFSNVRYLRFRQYKDSIFVKLVIFFLFPGSRRTLNLFSWLM